MGFVSHRVERSDLEAGDHIYTWRTAFTYSHHGIYMGENKVVHFTQNQNPSSPDSSGPYFSSSCLSTRATCLDTLVCGFPKGGSGVVVSCLNCFLGTGSLYRFEYGVSMPIFIAKFRGGTCTTAKTDPPETVVHRAMYLLHKGFGNYSLFTNNCEDFALYCKTGLLVRSKEREAPMGSSGQATNFMSVIDSVITLPLSFFVPSPVVFAMSNAATYSYKRYSRDIGVRKDVVKVRVEDIHGDRFVGDETTQSKKRKRSC